MLKDIADLAGIEKVALGPWRNEDTFWRGLVEKKRLPHLGDPDPARNALRDRLALGHLVFAGRPELPDVEFVKARILAFLAQENLRRIYFDITNIRRLSGQLGDGYFVRFELQKVLDSQRLFVITSFYESGKYLRMRKAGLGQYLDVIVENRLGG
jgi:hypothetical protein